MTSVILSGQEVIIDHDDSYKIAEFGPWCMNSPKEDKEQGRFYFTHNLPEQDGKRKCVRLHRLIAGAGEGQIIDHINGNTLDCRKSNLRVVDSKVNAINISHPRGVSYDPKKKLWRARIQVNKKSISLGRYKIKEDAMNAYSQAEKLYGYAEIRQGRTA